MIDTEIQFSRGSFKLHCRMRDSGFIGLTGPNGSGKSTFLHLLTGVEFPDSGFIRINDRDVTYLPINERRIVYLNPETYFSHAEVDRHLSWGRGENGDGTPMRMERVKERLGITYSGRMAKLSLGQRARVILGTAIMAEPRLILIDELLANISDKESVIDYIREVSGKIQLDVIFVTQDSSDLGKAGSIYHMDSGRLSKTS